LRAKFLQQALQLIRPCRSDDQAGLLPIADAGDDRRIGEGVENGQATRADHTSCIAIEAIGRGVFCSPQIADFESRPFAPKVHAGGRFHHLGHRLAAAVPAYPRADFEEKESAVHA